jgi:transposase
MPTSLMPLPETIEESHAIIHRQAAHIEQQATQIEQLEAKVNWFMEQLRLGQQRQYGKSSEKSPSMLQGNLFNEAELLADTEPPPPAEEITISYTRAKCKPRRKEIPQNLPIEVVEHRLPEEEQICACCGGHMHEMSTEERHEIELIPARGRIVKHVRYVYGCRNCEKQETEVPIRIAPAPNPVIPKSYASPLSLAYVMIMKYVDGLPLYRLEKHFERMGLTFKRSMLSDWVLKGADWLEFVYAEMARELLLRNVLAADETTVQVLNEPGRPAESNSYMWLYRTAGGGGPPIVLYDYQMTRSGEHPRKFLQGFTGYLHVDGYAGYDNLPNVILVGCWAHARRKFDEALKALSPDQRKQPSKAQEGLDFINKLFAIERGLKNCTDEERKRQRDILSRPVVDAFEAWLNHLADAVLPKCALGTAVKYCRGQWSKLIRFLEDGRLEIDNNRAERSIKPFVMGRKAWLFSNTPRGARASAIIYSIVETAKENRLNPHDYLVHLFRKLPNIDVKNADELRSLLSWNVEALPPAAEAFSK